MKLLNTLLPQWKQRCYRNACAYVVIVLISTFPSYSQCDINIFQHGTSGAGSVSLMPWLSYTSGCTIDNDCGDLSELVVWDMEHVDPCSELLLKPNIENSKIDISTSVVSTNTMFAKGVNNSSRALALSKGQASKFKITFSPKGGQSGQIMNLIYHVKSITNPSELICDSQVNTGEANTADYSVTILSRGKQMYMSLKNISDQWEQEIIDLDFISDTENLYIDNESLDLEIIFTNFTTSGNALLGLDDLIVEGKECVFDDNLAYEWSTGETTERIYSIKKGNYCVTVTDCNGCQAIDCIDVN